MRAVYYDEFGKLPFIRNLAEPEPSPEGVVVKVEATGLCRSDWHGWMGHDPDIKLPHVPGHEFAGTVHSVGAHVGRWRVGDRVTAPFVCGCGHCGECRSGNQQVCEHQFQPGFTAWGSFAEYVAIDFADANLVRLPDSMDFATAASLGCRFATSFRALVDQARVSAGEWVAVHGCGGVGLSAVMIASALGANVVAVDIDPAKLEFARRVGATLAIDASRTEHLPRAIKQATDGGAHVSIDALGHPATLMNSISCLRRRGRHVQVGLMLGDHSRPQVPMDSIVAHELHLMGSHGMQAFRYEPMLRMIEAGKLAPQTLIGRTIGLSQIPAALASMDSFAGTGITVVTEFGAGEG
jgi:alcohol dehydrogenase